MRTLPIIVTLVGLSMSACFGSSPQPVYYALEGSRAEVAQAPANRQIVNVPANAGPILAVTRFVARAPYDTTELIYRTRDREIRMYPFDLWTAKPSRMLAESVTQHLLRSRLFADVSYGTVVGAADYELRGEVVTIEERDVNATTWLAHLAMRFELISLADGAVVLRHAFDTERPVPARKVREVARVLDEILADELAILTTRLASVLPAVAP